jgi:antitoxin ParD1/3/4
MATNVHLTPKLEKFAHRCVKSGRYNNVSEVVRSALRLLEETEKRRQSFNAMLDEVRGEAEREGAYAVDSIVKEMDAIIAKTR